MKQNYYDFRNKLCFIYLFYFIVISTDCMYLKEITNNNNNNNDHYNYDF
jgi:hypothetical protein